MANFSRLSLRKAAHAVLFAAMCRKSGSPVVFGPRTLGHPSTSYWVLLERRSHADTLAPEGIDFRQSSEAVPVLESRTGTRGSLIHYPILTRFARITPSTLCTFLQVTSEPSVIPPSYSGANITITITFPFTAILTDDQQRGQIGKHRPGVADPFLAR